MGEYNNRKCIVNDVAAIIARLPMFIRAAHYTTRGVADEILDEESRKGLGFMVETGLLAIEEPGVSDLTLPRKLREKLSDADLSLLHLAFKIRENCDEIHIATDDYALQEAAVKLGFKPLPVRYRGARFATGRK